MRSGSLRLVGICAAAGLTLLATVHAVEARSAGQAVFERKCRQAAEADAVFEGTVEAIDPPRAGPWAPPAESTVSLRDIRPIRGEAGAQVIAGDGTSCSFPFRVGIRYLVFAIRNNDTGRLHLGPCELTRQAGDAAGLVRYVESLSSPDAGGRVWGRVLLHSASRAVQPMPSMRVTMSGPREMEMDTDANGEFEFVSLPPGSYSVRVTALPDRSELSFRQHELKLEGAHACSELWILPRINSRVEGRVLDQAGAPVPAVAVTLSTEDGGPGAMGMSATAPTNDQGAYIFQGLPEGSFTVHVRAEPDRNGLAAISSDSVEAQLTRQIDLPLGGQAVLEPIRLQRFERISLTGRVIDANGAGVGGVPLWVIALDDRRQWTRRFVTDDSGAFSVPAYRGRRQQLVVGDRQSPRADVTIVAGNEPVVITVDPSPRR